MTAVTAAMQEKGMDEFELIPEIPSDPAPSLPNVRNSGATISWGGYAGKGRCCVKLHVVQMGLNFPAH